MRITVIIGHLGPGGAEGQMVRLANHWVQTGHQTTALTYYDTTQEDHWKLDPAIRRVRLRFESRLPPPARKVGTAFAAVSSLSSGIRDTNPDVVVSFIDKTNVVTLLATRRTEVPVVISERVHFPEHKIGVEWRLLRRLLYPKASALVVQTERTAMAARRLVGKCTVTVIPNIVEVRSSDAQGGIGKSAWTTVRSRPTVRLVAVGRLVKQKGFDILIRAFSEIAARHPEVDLVILGEGPERETLGSLASSLRLDDRISLPGVAPDVVPTLRESDIFVLSSRYEGFPNVLLEAMSSGLAVVAADCPAGPSEIVSHEVDGLLVPVEDVSAMASAIERLVLDPQLRESIACRATSVIDKFASAVVLSKWDALLASVQRSTAGRPFSRTSSAGRAGR